ncbi:sensor histidine kinase RcsC [Sideroxyarcus emersonii]|uniref:histidine kinase n=1 Tax=Sideroxyarcus emersonii TaxID=2764705 RepID=A0AAN1XA58_9PROT|nr:ATP-binding protein [Sideroxyarcus emersonii]BCK87511.1 sensor histidine kinase RcsC [Sideroxyarcus emersonii]
MIKHGIERQTLAVAAIPMLVLALLLEGYFTYMSYAEMDRSLLRRANLIVRQLASSSEYPVFSGNQSLLQQQVDIAASHQDIRSVVVRDANLRNLAVAGNLNNTNERVLFENPMPVSDNPVVFHEDHNFLWLYQPILATQIQLDEFDNDRAVNLPNKVLGSVIVAVGKEALNRDKLEMLGVNLLLLLLVLLTTMLIAMRVSRRITLPVMAMHNAIRRIGKGQLDTRIAGNSVRELDALASGINDMANQLQQDRSTLEQRIEKATQELRLKKEEAEKANFDKSRFLAAASHDLRQPMHALGLFIGELRSRLETPDQLKIASKVEESVEALSSLLDSLLDISKLDAGIVIPQIQAVDMGAMMRRLQQDFQPIAQRKNITLRVRPVEGAVLSDPVLLERILLNLLSNAIRYTPQNGSVLLACRRRGEELRIEVRDNGIGIPMEEQQNIFREFVQLANSARDRSKGLGLGLAIVDRLCRLLHHPLSLRSAPSCGSNFTICVTRVIGVEELLAEPEPISAVPISRHDRLDNLQVLVVDDDILVRTSTAGILETWGCRVAVADSLREIGDRHSGVNFDLVICDYRLPDGDGLMLADLLKVQCDIPPAFILVSGDTAPEILQSVNQRGLHLMHKPVRPAKLRSLMLFLLKKRSESD